MTDQAIKRIPYATADYRLLRQDNAYYVDKTRDIPLIEAAPYYLFFIRPGRFGKTLWLTLLDYYYDLNEKEHFDTLFGETYIGQQPTAARNSYLTMTFNFSAINPMTDYVQTSFEGYGADVIDDLLVRYAAIFATCYTANGLKLDFLMVEKRGKCKTSC